MFFQISVLSSFRYIPRSGIAGSKGKMHFKFLRWEIQMEVKRGNSNSSFLRLTCCTMLGVLAGTGLVSLGFYSVVKFQTEIGNVRYLFISSG